ncbi:MAG: oligosaccharide flippase family protein [Chloroflexota bacterium]|nr:oligosaccharide flippase family protein [Chloroflexota bacterium]
MLWLESLSLPVSPVMSHFIDIEQITTQTDLAVIHKAALSPKTDELNSLLVDKQETLAIPISAAPNTGTLLDEQGLGAQGFAVHIRKLVKSSGIYALSSLASPLISLVLAPFLTRNLTRADYGAFAVLTTVIALLAGLTQLGLGSAFFRSYNYDYETPRDRSGVIATTILLLAGISLPVAVAMVIAAPMLATFLLNSPSFSLSLRLAGLVVLLQNLTIPVFAWLRAENRAGFFSVVSIANLLITLGATIVLVGVMHMGIAGSILAVGLGYGSVVVCTLPLLILRAGMRFRFDIAWGMLTFGLPNVASFAAVWILQLSDRYLLSHFTSLEQTASYAVAYSLGGALSAVIIAPFSLAWPSTMYAIARKDNAVDSFRLVFRWFSIILCLATFGLSLLCMVILTLFFPPSYHSAAPIIPIITISIMFYGVYNVFTLGISIQRKTWFAVIFTATAALANVGLNLILIPLYGPMGAALSTLLAYALLALIAYIVNQRIYPVPFEMGLFFIALVIGIGLYIGSIFLAQSQKTYIAWGMYIVAFALYAGCLVFLGRFMPRKVALEDRRV